MPDLDGDLGASNSRTSSSPSLAGVAQRLARTAPCKGFDARRSARSATPCDFALRARSEEELRRVRDGVGAAFDDAFEAHERTSRSSTSPSSTPPARSRRGHRRRTTSPRSSRLHEDIANTGQGRSPTAPVTAKAHGHGAGHGEGAESRRRPFKPEKIVGKGRLSVLPHPIMEPALGHLRAVDRQHRPAVGHVH